MVRASCHGSYGVFPGLIARRLAKEGALGLSKAWLDLGEPAEAARYRTLADHLDTKLHPDPQAPPDALTEHRGSNLVNAATGFRSRGSPASPPVTEPELRGGRLAEYAMYERLMMHAVAVLLTLALAFLLLVPWRSRNEPGLLPSRLANLLDRRDHAWIALLGLLLPAGLYVFSTRVPWMDPREFSLSGDRFFLWLTQALALVVAIVLGTLQAARWRLGRRGAVLALGWVGVDPGRLLFPVTLALIPIASVLSKLAESWNASAPWAAILVAALLAFPMIWLVMIASGCFRHAPERTLHRDTLMTAARPFVAAAMVAAAFAIPAIHRQEKDWTAQADFDVLKEGHSVFVPRFEVEYGRWIAQETLRRLNEMER
jgi:MFS family permease